MLNTTEMLNRLNSATKYPPIPTYHTMDKGKLSLPAMSFAEEVFLYEKVDGTNARIVVAPDGDWFIGSRNELLMAKGDRCYNPAEKIVDSVHFIAENFVLPAGYISRSDENVNTNYYRVYYGEVYGQGVGAGGKQYAQAPVTGFRLFDIAEFPQQILNLDAAQISTWRDNGGQNFFSVSDLEEIADYLQITQVPYLDRMEADALPTDLEDMHKLLQAYLPVTQARLDTGGLGNSEGIVLRTADRGVIAKARFEDYARTFKTKYPAMKQK